MPSITIVLSIFIILILAAVLVMCAQYRREIRSARQRLARLGSRVVETAGGPVEYALQGEGTPVLAVHGAMGGFDQGLWLTRSFDLSEYQVIAVSRFGYLGSPLPPGAGLDRQADAFASLLDSLKIEKSAVFAASAGSTSALRYAARYPERVSALVLLSPDAPGEGQMVLPPRWIFDTLVRSDFIYWVLVTFFGKWMQNAIGLVPPGYRLTSAQAAQVKTIQLGDLPVSRRVDGLIFESYTVLSEFNEFLSPETIHPLNKIKIPVLVIHALDDPIIRFANVKRLAECMPGARLFEVPEGGHFLFGHTEEVKAEIDRFLSQNQAVRQEVRQNE